MDFLGIAAKLDADSPYSNSSIRTSLWAEGDLSKFSLNESAG
jgi:hypothetical protein